MGRGWCRQQKNTQVSQAPVKGTTSSGKAPGPRTFVYKIVKSKWTIEKVDKCNLDD